MNMSKLPDMPSIDGASLEDAYFCSAADFAMDQELDFNFAMGPDTVLPEGSLPVCEAQQSCQQQWGGASMAGTASQVQSGLTLTKPFEQQTLLVYSRQPLYQPCQPAPPQATTQRQQMPPRAPAATAAVAALQRSSSQSSGGGCEGAHPAWGSLVAPDGAPPRQGGDRSADANASRHAAKKIRSRSGGVRGSWTGVQKTQSKASDNEERVLELEAKVEALRLSNAKVEERNVLLDKYLKMVEEPQQPDEWWMDERTRANLEQALSLGDHLTFTVYEARPLRLSRAEVTNLTFEQYEKLWKMFVDALSGLLLTCEGRYEEGTPTARRLTQLSVEAGFLHVALALAHPSRIASYHFSMGQDSPKVGNLHGMWKKVVIELALSRPQSKYIVELRDLFLTKNKETQLRRKAAVQQLTEALPQGDFNSQGGSRYIRAVDALEQLQQTLQEEHTYNLKLQVALWKSVLDPVQGSKLVVHAWPQYPDIHAIMDAVAEIGLPPPTSISNCDSGARRSVDHLLDA